MEHVEVKVSGEYACFSRPEMKVERVSYEVPTPSAARGMLDAILWKPEMRWHVLRIDVLKPIRFIALKRNEVQSKIPMRGGALTWMKDSSKFVPQTAGAGSDDATPRNTLALRDVSYIIRAAPLVFDRSGDNTPKKYVEMFRRRVEKGQCHSVPCLGCREFAARFEPPEGGETPIDETLDLGMMLYDIVFNPDEKSWRPVFFPARMERGTVVTDAEKALADAKVRREVLSCSYRR